jgi:transcriptional regulator with GAF, ATPase, and Fis domain
MVAWLGPVELYQSLFHAARLLLSEDDGERTPEILFRHMLEATGAGRGFIVVRDGETFEHRFDVRFDRDTVPRHVRSFSRSVVRQAIEARQMVVSPSLPDDPRFAEMESVKDIGASAVIVAPLLHQGEVYAVVYLEYATSVSAIPEEARRFIAELADIAGAFLHRAVEREALRRRTQALERDLFARHDFAGIVTRHPRMVELLRSVAQVADSDATVLVGGETGTGKELIARALHVNSPRRAKPFVTLHTSALPGTILESELFGHVRGAFTGADKDRAGRIAGAEGGTLFLDEVAEIAPEIQAKLLRFLQFGEIQRLGSDRTHKVDVRIVAATHQDLPACVRAGRFRQDLYFRLKVIELCIPPLRERPSDVPLLVEHFVRRHWRRAGQEPRWSARAERALAGYAYPGNVRELAHAVERACILATGPEMDVDLLPTEIAGGATAPVESEGFRDFTNDELEAAKAAALARVEADFLTGLMACSDGNVSEAARRSGIHRSQLQKLRARHRV